MKITAGELSKQLDGELTGDPSVIITHPDKIETAGKGAVAFLANPKYEKYLLTSEASLILVSPGTELPASSPCAFLKVEDPYLAFARVLAMFAPSAAPSPGRENPVFIHPEADVGKNVYIGAFAWIGKGAKVLNGARIFPQVYIGEQAVIGENTILYPGVKIYRDCRVGRDCIIHAGTVIGSDGFGYAPDTSGKFLKIPQTGNVVIEEEVEIGANCTIDRAVMGSTIIHRGTKIDNLVQIAHNVEIGTDSAIAAQVGISGSTRLGCSVRVGGQAGFVGHITVADRTQVNAQSGVSKSIKQTGARLSGTPAIDFRQHYKAIARLYRLEELEKRIANLEQKLKSPE